MTDRSNKIIDLTGRFRRALAADWRMTCTSFTSFYAFVKFVTTIHTTTCSIFKLYCSIFKLSNKNSVYIYTRVFLHTLQTAGDITHLTIHHKLFHASCLYYVSCITVVNPGYATDVIHFLSKVLLLSTDSKLLNYHISVTTVIALHCETFSCSHRP